MRRPRRPTAWSVALGLGALGLGLVLILGLAVRAAQDAPDQTPEPPKHIVLILVDTLRADVLSPYGGEHATPHVQALADRGLVFQNAVASFHQTTMSMGAMFTGKTPSLEAHDGASSVHWNGKTWCGLVRFASGPDDPCLPRSLATLAERLREGGYRTIGIQTNMLLFEPSGFSRGFDDWVGVRPEVESHMSANGDKVNTAVRKVLETRSDEKLFLYVHYMDVHDYSDRFVQYPRAVELMDGVVGRLFKLLERHGVLADAQVIFTSDHGEMLGEWGVRGHLGNPSFEPLLRVPLIAAPPVAWDPTALVRSEDLFALIPALAGLDAKPEGATALRAGEHFLSELLFQTHREGKWKFYLRRDGAGGNLYELAGEHGETPVDPLSFPDLVAARTSRVRELGRALAAGEDVPDELSPADLERLKRLGYVERDKDSD